MGLDKSAYFFSYRNDHLVHATGNSLENAVFQAFKPHEITILFALRYYSSIHAREKKLAEISD